MAAVNDDSADESLRELAVVFELAIITHLSEPSRLFQHLDPSLIPFYKQKTIFEREKQSPEEAVRIMLECLKNSKKSWFRTFKEALRKTQHEKLYKILNREEVDVNKYERLFHSYYPKFILDVNAREITQRLLSSKILQREDMEQIHREDDLYGNSRAMKKLIYTLWERNDKWFVHLVAAARQCGYIVDDINPRLKEAVTERSMESIINREAVRVDRMDIDLEDGDFDFRSSYHDWRKMKIESADKKALSRVQHSRPRSSGKQRGSSISSVRPSDDVFSEIITNIMQEITEQLATKCSEDLPAERKLCRGVMILAKLCKRRGTGSCRYEKVVETLKPDIQQVSCQNARESISSFLRHLWIYNSALMINDACRTQDAVIYLRDQMSVVRENHTSILCSDSSRWLDKLFSDMEGRLQEICHSPANSNPRLVHLKNEILLHAVGELSERGAGDTVYRRLVILCDSEEVVDALLSYMRQDDQFLSVPLNPEKLSLSSRKAHRDLAELFRRGHHLLVAVSSAVDDRELPDCEYRIDYTLKKPLLSDDVCMQSSMTDTSLTSASSASSSMSTDSQVYELRCLKCHADTYTRSSDLRMIKEHCVTVNKDFDGQTIFEECIRQKTFRNHWTKTATIKCRKCSNDLGVKALYKDHSYNVLKANSFELFDPDASCVGPFKTWNEVPFKIHKLRRRKDL